MKTLTSTVARIIFAIPFLVFSLGHLMSGPDMAAMIYVVSGSAALVLNYIAGIGMLLAAIAIIANKMARIASLLLALEMLIFVVVLHIPKMMGIGDVSMFCDSPEMMMQVGMVHAMKDFALMGAALLLAGISKE
jgi:uncharacterized membrane protein YphA (DoxX/SURF4 family)